jgi:hypothetical protein
VGPPPRERRQGTQHALPSRQWRLPRTIPRVFCSYQQHHRQRQYRQWSPTFTTGNNNIDIGNAGGAGQTKTIRIGSQGTKTATFIAGISGVDVMGGTPVEVTSAGQLGIVMSSARYKRDIADMGDKTSGLLRLRPVTFRYKNDQSGTPAEQGEPAAGRTG